MLIKNNIGLSEPEAVASECPELLAEVNVLRNEMGLLIHEIKEYSRRLRTYTEPLSDVADALDAIVRGE